MDIRGLSAEEIREALATANESYNGNLALREQSFKVPNPNYDPDSESWIDRYPTTYEYADLRPLNKRGDRFSARLTVRSTRRVGSRVSQERYSYYGPINLRPKRIGSACWHANRDFLRAIFDINPDAKVVSALATYEGRDDFEYKFPATYHGGGMAGAAPISDIGGACNCDEGDYPEFATEGLTDEQYEMRVSIWPDYPVPGSKQALKNREGATV